jgi:hypothetical protein
MQAKAKGPGLLFFKNKTNSSRRSGLDLYSKIMEEDLQLKRNLLYFIVIGCIINKLSNPLEALHSHHGEDNYEPDTRFNYGRCRARFS